MGGVDLEGTWEEVAPYTLRLPVIGGYLYKHHTTAFEGGPTVSVCMCFVPDPRRAPTLDHQAVPQEYASMMLSHWGPQESDDMAGAD